MIGDKPPVAAPAATLILLRPALRGFEVLLLLRASEINFAGANWVFPGGRIEITDSPGGDPSSLAAARNAAARECSEEAGLDLATESMIYYSHWTTPTSYKKRFATWFLLDHLGDTQAVRIDGKEIVDYRWLPPARALQLQAVGQLKMMPPTYLTLLELAQCPSIDSAREFALARDIPVILPLEISQGDQRWMLYPEDAAYSTGNPDAPGRRRRIVFESGKNWRYENSDPVLFTEPETLPGLPGLSDPA